MNVVNICALSMLDLPESINPSVVSLYPLQSILCVLFCRVATPVLTIQMERQDQWASCFIQRAREAIGNLYMVAVGVGSEFNVGELRMIATGKGDSNYVPLADFDALLAAVYDIINLVCHCELICLYHIYFNSTLKVKKKNNKYINSKYIFY